MPAAPEQLILVWPELPCVECQALVNLGRIKPLPHGRYTLIPVCSGHILTSIVREAFKAADLLESADTGAPVNAEAPSRH
jgi:hypothetical protein